MIVYADENQSQAPVKRIRYADESSTSKRATSSNPIRRTLTNLGIGGLPLAASGGESAEDALPAINQFMLGSLSQATPAKFIPGATAALGTLGATIGEGERQIVKKLKGEEADMGEIGKTALTTGLTEAAFGALGGGVFKREYAAQALKHFGGELGKMKKVLATAGDAVPELAISKTSMIGKLEDALKNTFVSNGPQGALFKKWLRELRLSTSSNISPRVLMEIENDFGQIAKFGQEVGDTVIQTGKVAKPALNEAAKSIRAFASGEVDRLADVAGIKGFADTSKKVSRYLEQLGSGPGIREQIAQQFLAGGAGLAAGKAFGTGAGAATFAVGSLLANPDARKTLFKAGKWVGRPAITAVSEFGRQI